MKSEQKISKEEEKAKIDEAKIEEAKKEFEKLMMEIEPYLKRKETIISEPEKEWVQTSNLVCS